MLPVVSGVQETRRQILIYSLLLVPIAFLPPLMGFAGYLYTVGVAILSVRFLWFAVRIYLDRPADEWKTACRGMFSYSIAWLFGVFALVLIERVAGIPSFAPVFG